MLGLALTNVGSSQQEPGAKKAQEALIQEAYAKHNANVRQLLPKYSGPPLLLDLSHRRIEDGMCDPEQHAAWEARFNGIMSGAYITDRGISRPSEATATALTTIDTFGPIYSLPARDAVVVVARPIAGRVCIPQRRSYVYTKFTLQVLKDFRPGNSSKKLPQPTKQVTAVEFGGSVRFPSGFLETFLLDQRGFMEVGKKYVLFMWKAASPDDRLVISQAYLIQDGLVYPVNTDGDGQKGYTKMPLAEFEGAVQAAVDRNIDTDLLPNVHATPR
ncbi:MAG: hypothetical protein ACRD6B_07430 [Bryobacteraceae bacterium]